MLNGLTSPFAFLFSIFIYHIRYKFIQVVGLLLGFVSAMLLTFERTNESLSFNSYALFIVLATISYGLNLNMVKHKLQDIPALALSYLSVSLAGLMAFIFFFIPQWSNFTLEQHQVKPLMALITLGVFGTAVAQVLYYKLIQISSPLFTSSVTFLIPIVALFWGVVDGEKLHIEHLFCIVGILIGVALIRKS
jgi:drug/metabolite transporter (DMT)-like permease